VDCSDGSGSKIFDPGRVESAIHGLGLNLENFPLKYQIFQFFSLRIKKNIFGSGQEVPGSKAGQPLIYCHSKVSSGQVWSGQGPSLLWSQAQMISSAGLCPEIQSYFDKL